MKIIKFKFSNNMDMRKKDFLSDEKISCKQKRLAELIQMLDLCGQLPCTASTPVFLTCGFSHKYNWYHAPSRD